MLITGIQKGTKKDGDPYIALHGISRRSGCDGFISSVIWSNPQEFTKVPVKVGDQIRGFRDGGYLVIDDSGPDIYKTFDYVL